MRFFLATLLPLIWFVTLTGCDRVDPNPIDQSTAQWILFPELRIGSLEQVQYTLTEILDVAVGPGGSIFVAQWQKGGIEVFDSNGRYLRTIGRKGRGPGEFVQPTSLGWVGDTLWAADGPGTRIAFFTPAGDLIRSINFASPSVSEHYVLGAGGLLDDGTILATASLSGHLLSRGIVDTVPLYRWDPRDQALDTIGLVSMRNHVLEIQAPGVWIFGFQPLSDHTLWDLDPHGHGVVVVDRVVRKSESADTYRVTKLAADGTRVFSRAYAYVPQVVTDRIVDSLVTLQGARRPRSVPVGVFEEAARQALYQPSYRPPVRNLLAGRDGTTWLETGTGSRGKVTWTVLDVAGEPLAEVKVPRGVRLHQVQRDSAWGVEYDSLDVAYIVRYLVRES